ncbi:MAG TPA: amylo-alpha-1,6-glucosidase [Candidatus Limnocylindrales bacterium]|nr:amylo-alpha-1,6-glucosidase [Candidatus Limnocylindrales bacterium]
MSLLAEVQFGREILGNLELAESREWLVTNGLGGFASGTAAGTSTRRYHGLLMASLQPPTDRTLLVAGVDEIARYGGTSFPLATNRWLSGDVAPQGFLNIESFHLEGTKPVWGYALADALLEKRVWMKQGENTAFVEYRLARGNSPIEIDGKILVTYRDFHATTHADGWQMKIEPSLNGLRVIAFEGATPFFLKSETASLEPRHEWYRDFFLPAERQRGLDDHEDRLLAAVFHGRLAPGEKLTLVFSTEPDALLDGQQARALQSNHDLKLFQAWQKRHSETATTPAEDEPGWLWQLVLAADQFIAKRALPDDPDGLTVIAGYPWFSDWGRDTMIAIPGLTLSLGRPEIARKILESFARYTDGGMLPNNFPDRSGAPQYNTIDAALWYFEAVRQYFEATQDLALINKLFPVLSAIVDAHVAGTRYNIKVDPADALLYGGGPDVQLTWMDAKVGDWVVTPRIGKPVEINALWINALKTMGEFARRLARPRDGYLKLREKAEKNFQKFWNPERNCCFDVIDVPGVGVDPALRPNQVFAVSLPASPLSTEQQKAIVDTLGRELLTSFGLRSLGASEPGYKGGYAGGPRERDSAYHQGTVWAWLLGPYALAHFKVYGDRAAAQSFLEPLGRSIYSAGLGSVSEIFGGDAPFPAAGCFAQAWSVAETFRAWEFLAAHADEKKKA